ncbi:MAG: hypothetical protein LBB80_00910 [Treponema sp.]|jgi:hypothetical protein|nr:hypothetical protein [Treponema sp.]
MAFTKELLDEILKDYHGLADFYGPQQLAEPVDVVTQHIGMLELTRNCPPLELVERITCRCMGH